MYKTPIREHPGYRTFLRLGVILLWTVLGVQLVRMTRGEILGVNDFAAYWGAAFLNLRGDNPYDPATLFSLEKSLGGAWLVFPMMWNPPWTLTLLAPLAALPYNIAATVWFLFSLSGILLANLHCWKMYEGPRHLALAVLLTSAFLFPAYSVLSMGQSSMLLYLGIIGFLWLERRGAMIAAGASLALVSIKPLVLVPFWIALGLWVVGRRRWGVAIGTAVALLTLSLVAAAANPSVFRQYLAMGTVSNPANMAAPTLGGLLRALTGAERFWVQFIPCAISAVWVVTYWHRRRASWEWRRELPILIAVSLVTMPYGWSYDMVLFFVPAIAVMAILTAHHWSRLAVAVGLALIALNVAAFAFLQHQPNQFYLFWFAPACLLWYLGAQTAIGRKLAEGVSP